jgi:hypothetical protein
MRLGSVNLLATDSGATKLPHHLRVSVLPCMLIRFSSSIFGLLASLARASYRSTPTSREKSERDPSTGWGSDNRRKRNGFRAKNIFSLECYRSGSEARDNFMFALYNENGAEGETRRESYRADDASAKAPLCSMVW